MGVIGEHMLVDGLKENCYETGNDNEQGEFQSVQVLHLC